MASKREVEAVAWKLALWDDNYNGIENTAEEYANKNWGLWQAQHIAFYQSNSRVDPCSRILKREQFKRYMKKTYKQHEAMLVLGIDKTETHRIVMALQRIMLHMPFAALLYCEKPPAKILLLNLMKLALSRRAYMTKDLNTITAADSA